MPMPLILRLVSAIHLVPKVVRPAHRASYHPDAAARLVQGHHRRAAEAASLLIVMENREARAVLLTLPAHPEETLLPVMAARLKALVQQVQRVLVRRRAPAHPKV